MKEASLMRPVTTVDAERETSGARQKGSPEGLSLRNVSVTFGKVRALTDVSVDVRPGEVLMLIGPNGAGKSTLIHVLLGLVRPDAGTIALGERTVSVDRAFKSKLGYLPEAIAFSENLTGAQVLRFFARARAIDKRRVAEVLERVGLSDAAKRRVRGYSRGMRQRLGLGVAILAEPPLLVLDEPTGGLDQEGLDVLFDVLSEWRDAGRLVLMATHDLTLLERRVDRVCVLKGGRRVALDTPSVLRKRVALPVRVTFDTIAEPTDLLAALDTWGRGKVAVEKGRVAVTVPPDQLLALMDVRAEHAATVTGLRVEEPGMDEIYEQLLAPEAPTVEEGDVVTRVARALALHELLERTRDRWVLVVSLLFAALASAVSAYGRQAGDGESVSLTGPSLVTLASLFVPLVALVLSHDAIVGERERNTLGLLLSLPISRMEAVVAKLAGRGAALVLAVCLGLGAAMVFTSAGERATLVALLGPTVLLGLAFLSLGLLLSSVASRQAVAASMVVVTWFVLVFFYDLALLALMVIGEGAISQQTIADLLMANPAGIYRITMMDAFAGPEALADLGLVASLPGPTIRALIWVAWIIGPVLVSGFLLSRKKVIR